MRGIGEPSFKASTRSGILICARGKPLCLHGKQRTYEILPNTIKLDFNVKDKNYWCASALLPRRATHGKGTELTPSERQAALLAPALTIAERPAASFRSVVAAAGDEEQARRNQRAAQTASGIRMKALLNRFAKDKSGATAIEYSLIAILISIAIIAGATALGGVLDDTFQGIADDNF